MSLEKKLLSYSERTKVWHLPFLVKEFKVEANVLVAALLNVWHKFPNPCIVKGLLVLDYKGEVPTYFEICDTKYNRGRHIPERLLDNYIKMNDKTDQHVSVFKHDESWRNHSLKHNNVRCGNHLISFNDIYLEIDGSDFFNSCEIALDIYRNFSYSNYMKFYTSGNRSIHIAVDASLFGRVIDSTDTICGMGKLVYNLAHWMSGGVKSGLVDPNFETEALLCEIYEMVTGIKETDIQKVKTYLQTIDPAIYHKNSLIRQINSYHEKTGNLKREMSISEIAEFVGEEVIVNDKPKDNLPHLIYKVFELYKSKQKQKSKVHIDVNANLVNHIFSEIDGFDPDDADEQGWVSGLYSPFYEDTNPAVSVNIVSGWYIDFGDRSYNFNMYDFYFKLKGVSEDKQEHFKKWLNDKFSE